MTFTLAPELTATRFYYVQWTNLPPAQPRNSWHDQAFDGNGKIIAAGTIGFTNVGTFAGWYKFTRMVSGIWHADGSGPYDAVTIQRSNMVEVSFGPDFWLRGQMTQDYWAGEWFGRNPTYNSPIVRGRFVALRRS